MNAREAVALINRYENHVYTVGQAEEKFRELGDDYTASELNAVGVSLRIRINELNERLESANI